MLKKVTLTRYFKTGYICLILAITKSSLKNLQKEIILLKLELFSY
ncbi:hypothetical protein AM1_0374 [Acaryochloris marina MBIC11017]|uniref:Uncharacterized protein n=1 Tax=Acaryochloris marina (strain MBIC 11017) TaxID=329726 RepID=B0C9Z0_ACAM1|nr:hypothetical protein AM1_0374 [Acaryochloris marina MBIC11017]